MYISRDDDATIHPVLTTLAIAYPQKGLVAPELCPIVDVGEENEDGTFFVFDKANLSGGTDDLRALGAPANTFDWAVSTDTYHCEERTLEKPIDWREFKKWKRYLDLARITQEITLELLLTNYDIRAALLYCTETNYDATHWELLAGATQWSDFVNSDPEGAVEDAREVVALDAAEPNAIAIPVKIWRVLRRHPAIRALMKESDSRQLTEDGFPKTLFGLRAIFPGARYNAAMPGATESIARIWDDHVWLGVINPRPSIRTMSFAYTLRADKTKIETYEDKKRKSDVVRVQLAIQDEKIVCKKAGYVFEDVLA